MLEPETFICTGRASPAHRNAITLLCSGTQSRRHIYALETKMADARVDTNASIYRVTKHATVRL